MDNKMKNLPVFLFPEDMKFYVGARQTHKQLLTMYNPYDFPVYFNVLCNSPNKFTVADPEGLITPKSCIDIVVRYSQPSVLHNNTMNKFRISMLDKNTHQVLGWREVPLSVIEGEPISTHQENIEESFHPITLRGTPMKQTEEQPPPTRCSNPRCGETPPPPNLVAFAVIACCIAVLMLPTLPEAAVQSILPDWLRVSSSLKLVFAFVLGLVSMLVLRP